MLAMKTHIFLFLGWAAQKIGSSVDGRGAATSNSHAFGNLPRVGVCADDFEVVDCDHDHGRIRNVQKAKGSKRYLSRQSDPGVIVSTPLAIFAPSMAWQPVLLRTITVNCKSPQPLSSYHRLGS
jgi:hypothetical protein